MLTPENHAPPIVAVIIPAFKQPSLLIEALESTVRQKTTFPYRILVIDDGCPYPDTQNVCREYAARYPHKVAYIRKNNGGLGHSRNAGIQLALRTWPSIKALYILDSDDRIGPHLLERAFQLLQTDPRCGWVSPDIREFGKTRCYIDQDASATRLQLLVGNCYSVASLIRREMFDMGVAYEEQKRTGYEDWDLWIQGAARGFHGTALTDGDFQYRRRAASMIVDSSSSDQYIKRYMRDKHAARYTIRNTATDENAELPRFAVYLCQSQRLCLTSDLRRLDRWLPCNDFAPRIRRFIADPVRNPFPPLTLFIADELLEHDLITRLLPGLVWCLQERLEGNAFATASIELLPGIEVNATFEEPNTHHLPSTVTRNDHVILAPTQVLHETLSSANNQWLESMLTPRPQPQISRLHVDCVTPKARPLSPGGIWPAVIDLVQKARPHYLVLTPPRPAAWKSTCRPSSDGRELFQTLFGFRNYLPYLPDRQRIHVGFPVPICSFGGVERVVCNCAREARRRGWVPHLFVVGSGRMRLLREFSDTFETITVVPAENLSDNRRLLGLLAMMDVVINNLSDATTAITSQLRQHGTKVFSHQHSICVTREGMPHGSPFLTLQHEHTLDGVVVLSRHLQHWLEANGVPSAKITVVPNSGSFAVSKATAESALIERDRRNDPKLRVLFLSRFDTEKGMDRLVGLIRESRLRDLPLTWRVVGQRCFADYSTDLSSIASLIEPPALTPFALEQLYRWADVLVLVSRFEGVPLTILEAQRFGCVVLATNVGAISEAVDSGKTGFLFPSHDNTAQLVDEMLACMVNLHQNPALRRQVSNAAATRRRLENWQWCFQPLGERIESMLAATRPILHPRPIAYTKA